MKTSPVLTETVESGSDWDRGFKNLTGQDCGGPYVRSLEHMEQRNTMLMGMDTVHGNRCYRRYDGRNTTNQS